MPLSSSVLRAAAFGATVLAASAASACPTPSYPGPGFSYTGGDLYAGQAFTTMATGGSALSACGIPGGRGYAADVATMSMHLAMMDGYALAIDVQSDCDSTLLLHTADGAWIFDDDSGGNLMPGITLTEPWRMNGRVDVWIGTYGGGTCPATITFRTSRAPGVADEAGDVPMGGAAVGCPNPALGGQAVAYTGAQLWSRQSLPVQASGTTRLDGCGIPGTRGYADPAPDYSVYLSGMQGYRLDLTADASCDSTMLVHTPDGMWHFNDDGHGNLDPLISLTPPTALEGRVDIWVGTYGPTPCAASLNLETFTAAGATPQPQPQPQPQPGSAALLGTWRLNANGHTGTLSFSSDGIGGYNGQMNLRTPEDLTGVVFDPSSGRITFNRPNGSQVYTGTVSGARMSGTFTSGGTTATWRAER